MSDTNVARAKLDLGRVVRDTLAVVRRRAPLLFGVTVALYLLPLIATGYYAQNITQAAASGDPAAGLALFTSPIYWGLVILSMLLGCFAYGFQLKVAISDLEGQAASLDEAVQVGLKRLFPVLGVSLLLGLGIGFGMLLLIVPGFILAVMWSVALPSVVERGGVLASFGHSRNLTRGNRWRIFGLVLVVGIVAILIQGILTVIVGGAATTNPTGEMSIFALVAISIYSWVISVLSIVGLAAIYVQLRELKGGGGESVAQVFS